MIDVLAALGHADATDDKPRAIKLVLMAEVRRTKTKSSIASLSLAQDFFREIYTCWHHFLGWFRSTRGQLGCPLRALAPRATQSSFAARQSGACGTATQKRPLPSVLGR